MGTLAKLPDRLQVGAVSYTSQQLDLVRRTSAKDCNDTEFSQFIHVCGHLQLDPMRKQIYALVYSKDKPDKRQMNIIIGIGGYRTVAMRSGNYRPDARVPRFTLDEALVSSINPKGIVKCEVSVYLHAHGSWFEVPHEVEWSAYAPVVEEWAWDQEAGKRKPTGKKTLEGRYLNDPFGMISKCAEAGALRKAFPDHFSGVYEQAEIDKQIVDLTAADFAEVAAVEDRLAKISGKDTILLDMMDDRGLHPIKIGKIHAECEAFLQKHSEPDAIDIWEDRNKFGLREFWAVAKPDALDIKSKIEKLRAVKTPFSKEAGNAGFIDCEKEK